MGDIVGGKEHGAIDLNHLIQPIIGFVRETPEKFLRERKGKVYAVTDEIIRLVIEDQRMVQDLRGEGGLFSNTKYADAIATLAKNGRVREKQMKHIMELEDVIYDAFCSAINGNKAAFSPQPAASCFDALGSASGKKADIDSQQRSPFPDAQLWRTYPGTKALLRVPCHTIQMSSHIHTALTDNIKDSMRIRLSAELPEDEIDSIIKTVEAHQDKGIGRLDDFLGVLDRDAYGRIRRSYACGILNRMAAQFSENSSAVLYARRVCDFNELIQATLPDSGLSADDLVLLFPHPCGSGMIMEIDLMAEFAYADALNSLPFWVTFSELLSEVTVKDCVTTTMGQHFKMNGKVPSKDSDSVYDFNISKLERMAQDIRTALEKGGMPPSEPGVRRVLRIAILYYMVFRDDEGQAPRDVLANYKEFRDAIEKLVKRKTPLDQILVRLAVLLRKSEGIVRQIRQDLKTLIADRRQLDNLPLQTEKLFFIISREILSKAPDMENALPIVGPPSENHVSSYLRYLKITRHPGDDDQALIKEEIRFTESLRYLTLPESDQRKRGMRRDMDREVLGVFFTPRNNDMMRLSLPFEGLTKLIISYDRTQLHHTDDYLAGLSQLIHVLLVNGVLKAVTRMDGRESPHADKPLLMILSLFSASSENGTSSHKKSGNGEKRGFTHDAHKAIEHVIQQHVPTKSQGFKFNQSVRWDRLINSGKWKERYRDIKAAAYDAIRKEFKDYRYWNIVTGLSSGLDALWELSDEPSIKKVALISVTSRACDRLRRRSQEDRSIIFGNIHRFEHEVGENGHFYRRKPVQALCDDVDDANIFKSPSVLFNSIKALYAEGVQDVFIVTKVPFTRRIRMTSYDDSTYANPVLLRAVNKEMPDIRLYPLFVQKSYGVRLSRQKTAYPMFLPPDAENDVTINDTQDRSTLFRVGSVVTCRVVEGGGAGDKLHSGITDYLFRCYPDTMNIQSEAMSVLTTPGKDQACLHEILRFLHSAAFEKSLRQGTNGESPLDAKLDALESVVGEESVGQQAGNLHFPKPVRQMTPDKKAPVFSVNIIALLKHLENQSDLYRKKKHPAI